MLNNFKKNVTSLLRREAYFFAPSKSASELLGCQLGVHTWPLGWVGWAPSFLRGIFELNDFLWLPISLCFPHAKVFSFHRCLVREEIVLSMIRHHKRRGRSLASRRVRFDAKDQVKMTQWRWMEGGNFIGSSHSNPKQLLRLYRFVIFNWHLFVYFRLFRPSIATIYAH